MKLRTLVFSGCGTRLIGHAGFIKSISENYNLDEVQNFAGTSAGCFITTGLVLGYTPSEIRELLSKINYLNISNIDPDLLFNYFNGLGVDDGDKLEKLIKLIIEKKTGNSNITFSELYSKTNKFLMISVTNLTRKKIEYLSKDTYPDMPIYIAIKMSCSIPYYFTPVIYNNEMYVDGAVLDNFPIENFDISETLGMYMKKSDNDKEVIDNVLNFSLAILATLLRDRETCLLDKYKDNTVVYSSDISMVDFKLSIENRNRLFDEVYELTNNFIERLKEKESEIDNEHSDEEGTTDKENSDNES